MKKTLKILMMTGILMALASGCSQAARKQAKSDPFVEDLIKKMTLEEKVGQMTQITLEVISKRQDDRVVKLDPAKLREAIVKYHVGSILNCGGSANTFENWQEVITAIQDVATKETRLKVPVIYGIDSIHGANYIVGATLFPQNFAISATGNVDLVSQASAITAMETRAAGIPWNFNPVLDMSRNPLWPRFWENYGEDPYISSVMAYAYIRAQQGDDMAVPDKVAACMKHYLGYSFPLTGKDRTPAWIPERMLREIFVPPFAAGARAGVATVMVNSSEINGIPVHSYKYALDDLLRGELGFDGFIVSDWADIDNLFNREKIASSQREAVKIAVMAGVDMSMVPYDYSFYNHLVDLVNKGEVPMSRIDQAVRNILKVKKQLGLFTNAYPDKTARKNFATSEATKVNLQAAQECITLLKNANHVLPLAKDKKVLVTGPTANLLSVLNGGWTITWQGDREDLYPAEKDTVLEAVQKLIGKDQVAYVEGTAFDKDINTAAAVEAARQADVVIACIGEKTYCETPGNINDLTLDEAQLNLVAQLAATGKPVVLVLLEGRPRIIRPVVDQAGAIVMAYLPGMEGGTAIASVLFGDINPSGKLPFTYPKYTGDLTLYDCKNSEKYDPQWGFGHGLSYTTFGYANLKLSQKTIGKAGTVAVSVDVVNTGKIVGKEIVQLYLRDRVRSVTPPQRQLKRFTKIDLKPGETKTVQFELTTEDLSFIGRENTRIVEPGDFDVMVANLKETLTLK
ncbi:MAG: beta-glucosidase [Phycisphaerae bacterium]|nr:beta-glucosidase [Phycisphaerae bacterium]